MILVVTGSRSLADNPDAEAWARGWIEGDGGALIHKPLLVVGDARGPDTWAWETATKRGIDRMMFRLDGTRVYAEPRGTTYARWHVDAERGRSNHGRRWPLVRNIAMMDFVANTAGVLDEPARCLGLIDPRSSTNGTRHTLRLARERGIECVEMEWRGG